jgi:Tfp pilus assembly protein PilV
MKISFHHRNWGFVLLEAMLSVAIFALGVLTLSRCLNSCLEAEQLRVEDARARQALSNRISAIEAGAVPSDKPLTEKLTGSFAGMELQQSSSDVKMENEKREPLTGLRSVNVQVTWLSGREKRQRDITFYVQARSR